MPNPEVGTLTVRLHYLANASSDQTVKKLCEELSATKTVFPRTNLRLDLKREPTRKLPEIRSSEGRET